MKQAHKLFSIATVLFVLMLIIPTLLHAQGPDGTPGDPDVPIDGGLSLLVAAGVGYGVKKVREKRK